MKKVLLILGAAMIVLAFVPMVAGAATNSEMLFNGITYFEPMPSCEHAVGIATGGAAGPVLDVPFSNQVTLFETVKYTYGMGACINALTDVAPAPVRPYNGITYFEMK